MAKDDRYKRPLEFEGQTRKLNEWANVWGISVATLYERIYLKGMPIEEAKKPAKRNGSWQAKNKGQSIFAKSQSVMARRSVRN